MFLTDTVLPELFLENLPEGGGDKFDMLPLPTVDAPTIDKDVFGEALPGAVGFKEKPELEDGDNNTPQLPTTEAGDMTDTEGLDMGKVQPGYRLEGHCEHEQRTKYVLRQHVVPPD